MEITLINRENQQFFESFLPPETDRKTDLAIGVVNEHNEACGAVAVSFQEDSLLFLKHIQVAEPDQGKGTGTMLLDALARFAAEAGCDVIYCQYLKREGEDWPDRFFEKNGYQADDKKSGVYVITLQDLRPELFAGTGEAARQMLRPLRDLSVRAWNRFLKKAGQSLQGEDEGVEFYPAPFYDQELSFLILRDQEPLGGVLFSFLDGEYVLEYLGVFEQVSPALTMGLLTSAFEVIRARGHDTAPIYINALTDTTEKMVRRMTKTEVKPIGEAVTRFLCL